MDIKYVSTRGDNEKVTASQAILSGIAPDGGLYVPETFPKLDKSLEELKGLNYREIAYEVMKLFREFDNLIRYEVHQSQIWLIFFVKS